MGLAIYRLVLEHCCHEFKVQTTFGNSFSAERRVREIVRVARRFASALGWIVSNAARRNLSISGSWPELPCGGPKHPPPQNNTFSKHMNHPTSRGAGYIISLAKLANRILNR